jgi:hypothetical protein
LIGGSGVAILSRFENARDVAHTRARIAPETACDNSDVSRFDALSGLS